MYKLVCPHLYMFLVLFFWPFFCCLFCPILVCVSVLSYSIFIVIFIVILLIPGCFLRRDRKSLDLDGQEESQRCWGGETIIREYCRKK